MAIDLKVKYLEYYKAIAKEMTSVESVYDLMIKRLLEEFQDLGIDNEQKADKLSTLLMQIIPVFEELAGKSAREVIVLESDVPLKAEQANEAVRKTQYYDDRLLETVMEKQADLASFAVNANSDSSQSTINDLKVKMSNIEARVTAVGTPAVPATVVPYPTGLLAYGATATTLNISWNAVVGATSYTLYRDGVQIASTGSLSFVSNGLSASTKYAYNVKAYINTFFSDLSPTVMGTTIA